MTQEKPQPPGKICERENLYLSLKNTAADKKYQSQLISTGRGKILPRILCQPRNLQTQKFLFFTLDFRAAT